MVRRHYKNDPCRDCAYSVWWTCDDESITYICEAEMDEDCDGEPGGLDDYQIYRKENPREL